MVQTSAFDVFLKWTKYLQGMPYPPPTENKPNAERFRGPVGKLQIAMERI